MSLLETRHLHKVYRAGPRSVVQALQDVTLNVPAGSFTLLTGPSGSGKTTLLALLGGLERPTQGQVHFAERDLAACSDTELARLRRRMGFVFQDFALLPRLPVWENITYPLIPRGVPAKRRWELAGELLARFGMPEKLAVHPGELSSGEQQRVALARALAGKPEVLLADEPTSNLDEQAGRELITHLQQVHAEGMTIIAASHDPRFAALATQTLRLQAGRLVAGPAS
jgi:putative ABC transport system ATP-binding protein